MNVAADRCICPRDPAIGHPTHPREAHGPLRFARGYATLHAQEMKGWAS